MNGPPQVQLLCLVPMSCFPVTCLLPRVSSPGSALSSSALPGRRQGRWGPSGKCPRAALLLARAAPHACARTRAGCISEFWFDGHRQSNRHIWTSNSTKARSHAMQLPAPIGEGPSLLLSAGDGTATPALTPTPIVTPIPTLTAKRLPKSAIVPLIASYAQSLQTEIN